MRKPAQRTETQLRHVSPPDEGETLGAGWSPGQFFARVARTQLSTQGRKAVVILSEGFTVARDRRGLALNSPFDGLFADSNADGNAALRMITEVANRASVVLYTIDPRGLMSDGVGADSNATASQATEIRESNWFARVEARADSTSLPRTRAASP
ncbi:MAG: hypothetical protein ABI672_15820 [Vicinamibacteria bacterium]